MPPLLLGDLIADPVADRPDLVAPHVAAALAEAGLDREVHVAAIDPAVSDTAATEAAYRVPASALVNCVIVGGSRDGVEKIAACLVPSTVRADVNNVVRRHLEVRKASFLPREAAVAATAMEFGAITPVGLPEEWSILVDPAPLDEPIVVLGAGLRGAKLLLPGALLARLPGVEVLPGLGRAVETA